MVPAELTPAAVREHRGSPLVTTQFPLRQMSQRLGWEIEQAGVRISQLGGHGALPLSGGCPRPLRERSH